VYKGYRLIDRLYLQHRTGQESGGWPFDPAPTTKDEESTLYACRVREDEDGGPPIGHLLGSRWT
jgi:hypothetical protein